MEQKTAQKLIKLAEEIAEDPDTKTSPAMVMALTELVKVLF